AARRTIFGHSADERKVRGAACGAVACASDAGLRRGRLRPAALRALFGHPMAAEAYEPADDRTERSARAAPSSDPIPSFPFRHRFVSFVRFKTLRRSPARASR
ncbi:hypothetical protein, partial [uncultured Alistipes sp.]|uniref:hypothetical protein n=1 Tax=uncultured Alistipes sp. TaxID=538949 RepID=UPI00261C831A